MPVDLIFPAIQKTEITPEADAASGKLGRAAAWLYASANHSHVTVTEIAAARDAWDAARTLIALRELVRECGRVYVR